LDDSVLQAIECGGKEKCMGTNGRDWTRRGFLATAFSGLVSAGFFGAARARGLLGEEKKEAAEQPKEIVYRKLGKTGIKLPIVSMGVMNADNPAVVRASYELGIRHFDTAAYYQGGKNEEMVGKVIRELGVRDKVVIGTKIFHPGQRNETKPADIKKRIPELCDISLKRLDMDYVDILYIHNLKEVGEAANDDIIAAMLKLKEQGKARHIGVTTHTIMNEIIDDAVKAGAWEVILTAINFTLADNTDLIESIDRAAAKGIGIIAMKTQAGSSRRAAAAFGDDYATPTIATAALKWVLKHESIATAVPGYTTFEHMNQDFSVAYGLDYTPEELELMESHDIKVGMGFCRQCDVCRHSCPRNADIASLMRTYMYAASYSNFYQARATLDDIPKGRGLDACGGCSICSAKCAHSVDIARNIDELKQIYV
jgi:predicted aldo/keto reductase-like oxidoreductase